MRGIIFISLLVISIVLFAIGNPGQLDVFMRKIFNIAFPLIVGGGLLVYLLNREQKKGKKKKKK